MSTSISLPALGLAIDLHPGAAPKGAMSQADNVVGDLPGMLRGRPNNTVVYSEDPGDPGAYARIDTLIRFGDEWIAHQDEGGSEKRWRNSAGAMTGITSARANGEPGAQSAQARGSLYVATIDGVGKIESPTATAVLTAGVEMAIASEPFGMPKLAPTPVAPTPLGPFDSPFSVGYRLVVKRTDANGYAARSAPSMIFTPVDSGTAVNGSVLLWGQAADERWTFTSGTMRSGDVVEFYRTKIVLDVAGPLPPDMYLVATYELDATDISNGYFPDASRAEFYDTLEDDQLGEALYTNPGREGALAARYTPPTPEAIALWGGAMWFGNCRERERVAYQLTSVGGGTTPASGLGLREKIGSSIGLKMYSAAWASGVASLTVASIDDLVVGMSVFTSSAAGPSGTANFPAYTTITSFSGAGPYTVNLSAAPTTTTGATDTYFGDVVSVDGVKFFATFSTGASSGPVSFGISAATTAPVRVAETAYSFALVVNAYMMGAAGDVRIVGTPPLVAAALGGSTGLLVFEGMGPTSTFSVGLSTAPDAFTPSMDKVNPIGATVKAHRLYWSQPDEPEAVRLLSFVDIGDERGEILALSSLQDALLVWKEDGLFRVTGAGPDRWSVHNLDATLVLSRSSAADVLRGMAYAVTNRGFVAVSEGGVSSLPAQGKVETLFRDPVIPSVTAWEQLGLVLVSECVDLDPDDGYADRIYCFSTATGVWSRWPNVMHSAVSSAGREAYPFIAETRPDYLPLFEVRRFLAEEGLGYDSVWEAIAIASRTGSTLIVTDAARGAWYPEVGDWVKFGAVLIIWGRVIAVDYDGANNWTLTLDRTVPGAEFAATLDAYEGAPVQLEWLPSSSAAGTPFSLPLYREAQFGFSHGPATVLSQTTARFTFGVRNDQSQTIPEVVGTPLRSVSSLRPYRMGWPRESARRAAVWPRLGFSEIAWSWRLAGLAVVGEIGSERTRR